MGLSSSKTWTTQNEIDFLLSLPALLAERREGQPKNIVLLQMYKNYLKAMPNRKDWGTLEQHEIKVVPNRMLRKYQMRATKEFINTHNH